MDSKTITTFDDLQDYLRRAHGGRHQYAASDAVDQMLSAHFADRSAGRATAKLRRHVREQCEKRFMWYVCADRDLIETGEVSPLGTVLTPDHILRFQPARIVAWALGRMLAG